MSRKQHCIKVALFLVLVCTMLTGCFGFGEWIVEGVVKDEFGNPMSDVILLIETKKPSTVKTDEEGNWSATVSGKSVTISVSMEGYEFEPDEVTVNKKDEQKPIEFTGKAALTASPSPGSYSGGVEVKLSIGGDYIIYYTLDGTDPTTDSTEYSAPFTLTETTTVKAIAVNSEDSSIVDTIEVVYTIGNILANSQFEEGLEPWEGQFGAQIEISDEVSYSGKYSVKTVNRGMTGHGPKQVINDVIESGATYVISAKVYYDVETAPAERDFNLTFQNGEYPDWISHAQTEPVKKGEWTTIEMTYTVPEEGKPEEGGLDLEQQVRVLVETSWVPEVDEELDLFDFYVDDFYMVKIDTD